MLGDHTDVFGLMCGFNTLLSPLGIEFRFDSAYKVRESCAVARRPLPMPSLGLGTPRTRWSPWGHHWS